MGSAAALAGAAIELNANPLGMPIGCQSYIFRDTIGKDFQWTLKKIAGFGFQGIEMCSPAGYVQSGFGPLMDLKTTEIRHMIHDAGLDCVSSHFTFPELKEHLDDRIAFAKELGLTQMICSSFWLPDNAPMAAWQQACDDLNKAGEQTAKAGLPLGFHNHHFEFREIDGVLIYDELMKRLDPKLIKMQFQVAIPTKYDPIAIVAKYPGRFLSTHLQDRSTVGNMMPIGSGAMDWKKYFAVAKAGGIKNYFVEMDGDDLMKASVPYLHNLKV